MANKIFKNKETEAYNSLKMYVEQIKKESQEEMIVKFKRFIIDENWFDECPEYSKDCPQCEFWKSFNKQFGSNKPRRKK